jgi:hypothetical protein
VTFINCRTKRHIQNLTSFHGWLDPTIIYRDPVVPLLRLLNLLLRESSKIYIENSQQIERKIILQDQEITPLFDTPYLIKRIRNYRITKDLV